MEFKLLEISKSHSILNNISLSSFLPVDSGETGTKVFSSPILFTLKLIFTGFPFQTPNARRPDTS